MTTKQELNIGDIAYCSDGLLGVILRKRYYHDGDGILRPRYIGKRVHFPYDNWESIDPTFYTTLEQIVDLWKLTESAIEITSGNNE